MSSGSLRSYLTGICIPGAGTEVFEEPSASDMADWAQVIEYLIDGNVGQAADLADWLLYDLVKFTDSGTGCVYYVLVEQLCSGGIGCPTGFLQWDPEPCRGLGTYVYNPHPRRDLNIQSPHALTDGATWPESVAMFLELQATFLQVTGVTRCANSGIGCSGTTATCGGGPYRESDAAHFTRNFYQVASTTIHGLLPDVVGVSVHAFEACDSAYDTSIVQISNGTGCEDGNSAVPNSIATQLAIEFNRILENEFPIYPGRLAGSCNVAPGEPAELERVGCPAFCGGSNTQGREINQAADPCAGGVCSAVLPERFIHMEQQLPLRVPPPGLPWPYPFPGMSWQISIDAFGATFPTYEIWADFGYFGTETGSFCQPYGTLAETVSAANPGERILIKTGSSPETLIINDSVIVDAYGGPAIVGTDLS